MDMLSIQEETVKAQISHAWKDSKLMITKSKETTNHKHLGNKWKSHFYPESMFH